MTPALIITIVSGVFAMLIQVALGAYMYGRLTMKVEKIEETLSKKANDDRVETVETNLDKLSEMLQRFIESVDKKLDEARESAEKDDEKILAAVDRLGKYMEDSFKWIGDRFGDIGHTLSEQEHFNRKVSKATNASYDRLPAQQSVTDTGRHRAITPPPRPAPSGGIPAVRRDPRSE